jgi:hypothetical protein
VYGDEHDFITAFGVGFGLASQEYGRGSAYFDGLNITTTVKGAPGCRGTVRERTCTMRPAIVEYAVRLTKNSISLRRGPDDGYRLDERAEISRNISADANEWRPRQDRVRQSYPPLSVQQPMWQMFFPLLYEPTRVEIRYRVDASNETYRYFLSYIDCVKEIASNTSCRVSYRPQRRNLVLDYAVEPQNTTSNSACEVYWRDPMQVCYALLDGFNCCEYNSSLSSSAYSYTFS